MQKDAEANASNDQAKKDLVEAKNLAEQLVYTSEKALKDAGDKVPADVKSGVEAKVADLKKAKEGSDLPAIKSATELLSGELQKIGQHMNQANQQTAPEAENKGDAGEGASGNVRDAETK
jgi:molecular chaperone DnaK